MEQFELKAIQKQYDELKDKIPFEYKVRGLTPYEAIKHLCKTKKELFKSLERSMNETRKKIVVLSERFEQFKKEIN